MGNIFVVTDNNKVIGILEVGRGIDKYKDYGRLGSLYLLPEYKCYGIGKKLFKIAIKRLSDLGYKKMELECLKGNSTINFYKKYGGKIIETINDSIYNTPVEVDIVIYDDLDKIKIWFRGDYYNERQ